MKRFRRRKPLVVEFETPILITANGMKTEVVLKQINGSSNGDVYLEFYGKFI